MAEGVGEDELATRLVPDLEGIGAEGGEEPKLRVGSTALPEEREAAEATSVLTRTTMPSQL